MITIEWGIFYSGLTLDTQKGKSMMKKLIVTTLMMTAPMLSMAKDYGAAGCGVGAIIFEGQSGLGPHVLAATTNGFYGTQTFAMSSGTLGCDVNGTIQSHAALYIDGNMENIAAAMAQGQGNELVTLAATLGIAKEDHATFAAVTQKNFSTIFSRDDVTSTEVMASLVDVMKNDKTLVKYAS